MWAKFLTMKWFSILLVILFCSSQAFSQANLPDNFFIKFLDNGLEVLVIEDKSIPLATIEICVRNGAYTESPEYDGLSHLYEHMFFKANKELPSQEAFLERVQELGIVFNGTTSEERVNYYLTLHKTNLENGLNFINTAIRYPLFLKEEMIKENPVVDGEFQRSESSPVFHLLDGLSHNMWKEHYSRKNVIGDHDIIMNATPEKMNFIKSKFYYPNNTLLAVAGDVNHSEVFEYANTIFGDWEASDFDPFEKYPIPEFEPLKYSMQFVVESENARVPYFVMAFHGPDTRNDIEATYAADVFSFILSQSSSKFHKDILESGLTVFTSVGYQTLKHVGPIQIISVLKSPEELELFMKTLNEHIDMWDSDDYFTDEQMQTSKDLLAIDDAYSKEKTSSFIHTTTYWWASADIDYYVNYMDNLQKVTREDIKKYVRKYIKGQPYVAGLLVHPMHRAQFSIDEKFIATRNIEDYLLEFDYNSAALNYGSKEHLNSLSQWLDINPDVQIKIHARADKSEKWSKWRAKKRLKAATTYLVENGIGKDRLNTKVNKKLIKIIRGPKDEHLSTIKNVTFSIN